MISLTQTPHVPGEFTIRPMTPAEIALALDWAATEGWNPGKHDPQCFRAADPGGFFIGILRGEPIACISAVAYDNAFGFIGLYIVKPEFRGMGFGLRIWQHAMAYLGKRNIGLDGVVAQQANYRKSGFKLAYRNIRFQGVMTGETHADVKEVATLPFEQLLAYDARFFPSRRPEFLAQWVGQADAVALAVVSEGRIKGYAVLRACREGCKIGPLFADDEHIAGHLLGALAARFPGQLISLDVPEANPAAVALAERHGMTRIFETARMYTREAPAIELEGVFGVTTFELG
ncbi:Acetyltransferase (GNAT) family protein [Paraburkholderia phenazinium]|uniref:Acetyltransferase (GNAT) family protein n=2 Tax=Paraburkholderia phenazinium TaxID=60549 RepID=A0A1G8DZ11_9BURK|nr:GNAT family N-acetyltransferase [Paraburkholderia phenazinium]SDH62972.1 Acetyltransferase (GNAT) family protein [Paraburkholderia phenazinium]